MNNRLWLVVLVVGAIALYGSVYFFSVPERCACRTSTALSPPSQLDVIDNSIEDSNSIVLTIGRSGPDDIEQLRICYPHKPKRGRIWESAGISEKACEYENWYHVETGGIRKTATEALVAFELAETQSLPNGAAQTETRRRTSGRAYFDRGKDACELTLSEWKEATLKGEVKCQSPVFYFNLWSYFPQSLSGNIRRDYKVFGA